MRIGEHSIPDLRLFPKIYADINLIYENYVLEEAESEDSVARLVGHNSANSGAWKSKMADMRLYGLVEPRAVRATALAERLTHGTKEQKQEAINEAILNVPLWKDLHERFGVEVPDSNFWLQLQRITGLSHLEAQKHADFVRKAYLDDIGHIKLEKEAIEVTGEKGTGEFDISKAISEGVLGRVIVKDAGFIDVKDKTTYQIAKAYLKIFAEKLGIKEKAEEEG